ncbi:NAD(P)-dependent oxidoreductase [Reyranella sp. CPCC 100927]|uniref:NAD(P)-dependent oxidoreductase n=1 Tax=Reyranella sp. CPCC 100927 TaxID=2599616 RepID=UPI0011B6E702|nr:NAD(P)-dependent oxidoreductase [Reyranella sp. CPCC 100927]TWT14071.1 hydroxyacid dehydrogenase [Reyranella sp. CPCC 100927]
MTTARNRARVFLTHPPAALAGYFGDRALGELRAFADVTLNTVERELPMAELVAAAAGHDVIISYRQTPGEAVIFTSLPDLVAFQRVAVDIRNIDVAAASAHGVLVTRASPGFVPAVVEWILGAMIDAARHISDYTSTYRGGAVPGARMGGQLQGATLGVIGYGAIGTRLCTVAQALGLRVLVHDPYKRVAPPLEQTEFAHLLSESDFVVPLAVATPETENLIDAAALARMKPTAWLINASRGNLVDEQALERALDARRIAGAAMDVGRAPDQMPSPHLARRTDVIATPHIGGLTPQAIEHQALEAVRQCAIIVRGDVPDGAVNADQATRLARLRG